MSKFKIRQQSSIYNIRVFHNWVKRELINQSCDYLRQTHDVKDITLLDLAVGRSGDASKWFDAGIMHVVGFDIDADSIAEARKRYNDFINQLKRRGIKNLPKYEFHVMDLSTEESVNAIGKLLYRQKFHIVSCQFAIHYFFRTMSALHNLITIVENHIDPHGFFIGTTMNGTRIAELLTKNKIIGNDIFQIQSKINNTNTPYGNKYIVSLGKESDTDHYFSDKPSEEYLVDIKELERMANLHNLVFVGTINFSEWYDRYNKNILSDQEKQFSFLNFSFVFKMTKI